jgi:hypothetical protein
MAESMEPSNSVPEKHNKNNNRAVFFRTFSTSWVVFDTPISVNNSNFLKQGLYCNQLSAVNKNITWFLDLNIGFVDSIILYF